MEGLKGPVQEPLGLLLSGRGRLLDGVGQGTLLRDV